MWVFFFMNRQYQTRYFSNTEAVAFRFLRLIVSRSWYAIEILWNLL